MREGVFNKFDLHVLEHPDAPGAKNFIVSARRKAVAEIALLRQCLDCLDEEDEEYLPILRDLTRLEVAPGLLCDEPEAYLSEDL